MTRGTIEVGVAVVRDPAGQVLLAERTARQVAAGFWELPGGKIEPGETPAQGAARELLEETGLQAGKLHPFMSYAHAFPTKSVMLHIFQAATWHGTPSGREGQRLAWADPAAPAVAPILPSNHRVLAALGLPPRLDIVDLAAPRAAWPAGARLLLLHGGRLAPDQRVAMARRIAQMARDQGARVLLAGSAQEAARAGVTGLHSSAAALRSMMTRPPVLLWSVSCDDADDRRRAEALGADLVVTPNDAGGPAIRQANGAGLPTYIAAAGHQTGAASWRPDPPMPHPGALSGRVPAGTGHRMR
jgi:8-oxo-dGTP diphosphatase